ncbi:hypothetical protein [Catenovulum sediminis]|uniref:Lipoprotein n=1 Tax=Catenovulum sediminis TaxID=1740262 RepID=A0ABV1RH69_9ALTE
MKLTFKHTALSLALAGSFTLTGCNFIGSGDPVFVEPTPVEQVAVSGTAVKGVLANAIVKAFTLSAPTVDLLADQGIRTNTDGSYTFDLEGVNEPVIVEIEADADTTMVCDSASGCGDVQSGGTVSNLTGLKLSTVAFVEAGSTTVSAPVNTMTSIAADIVKASGTQNLSQTQLKAKLQKDVLDLVGLDDGEQAQIDLFSDALIDATNNSLGNSTANDVVKKLSAINGALSAFQSGENVGTKISTFVATVAAATKAATPEAIKAAVDAADVVIKKTVAEAVKVAENAGVTTPIVVQPPKVTLPGGGVVTGGTGGTGASGADS